ncbi:MAG: choice-of-anchor Q domain-containing protein [Planctomycetota bacterium]
MRYLRLINLGRLSGSAGDAEWERVPRFPKRLRPPFLAFVLASLMLGGRAAGATFTVTSTNDSGAGSLRQAMLDANAAAGTDTIAFNVAGAGPHTINLLSALPNVTEAVIIDGRSEPDFAGTPVIELNGSGAGAANGLRLAAGSDASTVCGLVINRFSDNGIVIESGGNTVVGNYIGTDVAGLADQGNANDAVVIINTANNTIGGTATVDRNLLSGNGLGVRIGGSNASGNKIIGNYIGADANGNATLGNTLYGVFISRFAGTVTGEPHDNQIGGTVTGEGNLIVANAWDGVGVYNHASIVGNSILGNRIYGNTELGTDLNANGVSANDAGDADTGGNGLQNFPVLTGAGTDGARIAIAGTLNSTAYATFRVEFFANAAGDGSGYGEGQTYLGYVTIITEGNGDARFVTSLSKAVPAGQIISATATVMTTGGTYGSTSEFAQNLAASSALVVDTTTDVVDGTTTSVAALLAAKGADGKVSLREAIIATNNTVGTDTILVPAGTYTLTRAGISEDLASTGDLDILDGLILAGAGSSSTTIAGNALDRVINVYNSAIVDIYGITVSGGVLAGYGGGMYPYTGTTVTMKDVVLRDNQGKYGGGIYAWNATLFISDSTVSGNVATGAGNSWGGGIFNDGGRIVFTGVAVTGNQSGADGAGIYTGGAGSSAYLTNVTLSGNTSSQTSGGLYTDRAVTITNSTITLNTGTDGGGLRRTGGASDIILRNTIVSGNTATSGTGPDVDAAVTSLGNNIVGNTTDSSGWVASDKQNVNPLLGALANNGGPTNTHALLVGSPAINAGSSTNSPPIDQRGYFRDASIDIGAYEYNGTNPNPTTAGITVNPTSGLVTTEAGGTATFTVVLDSQPTANVVVGLSSSDTTEGTVSPASVTFTSANWNTAQTVTITGADDSLDDGNIAYTIVTAAATSTDANYNGLNASDVSVTNTDNDTAGITVNPTSGLVTTEAGGTAQFTLVLNSQPSADVTIGLSSSDTTEGTVSPASLTFTSANWNTAQTVTVTGADDSLDDGNIAYSIVTAAATSGDANYNGLNASDVSTTNTDNDTVGITVNPTSGLVTTEAGGTAQFTVVLNSQPTADVTIGLSSSDTTEGTVSPASVTFTSANWNTAQTVTVTGVNDGLDDGDIAYTIVTAAAASADANYNGLNPSDVSVTNTDNDTAGITVNPTSGLVTTEAGGTAQFTIVLTSQPSADVTIGLSSSDTTEGTVSPASLTFTSVNWNTAQTVTVTGADDALADGNIAYSIVTAAATSADAAYNGLDPTNVSATNNDDEAPGITVSPTSGLVTTEVGGTAQFTVVLNTQPTANVTIGLSSSDLTEGTVSPASLTFTSVNWNTAQTVTVTGVDDSVDDGDIAYTIVTAAAASADGNYNGLNASDVSVTSTDNDAAGFTVNPTSGLTTTEASATATFTVVLTSQPTADVTIGLSSSDTTEGTVSPASLTFTSVNWNAAQTVTTTGVDDAVDDGNIAYTIVTAAAGSADASYNGLDPGDVSGTNTDNDTAGITVNPTSGLVTTEAGGTAQFTIVLNSQPTADVTIAVSSSDTSEGTVLPAGLTFTSANWNTAQTVTVTGVNDFVQDGNIAYSIATAAAASADATYNGVNPADVSVTNTDNDTAGITVTPASGLVTTEAGGSDQFTVVLTAQPAADVSITISSSDSSEGTVSPGILTFTSVNWNVAQAVTVTGVDDAVQDGNVAYIISTAAAVSADANYNGLNAANVSVTSSDNDVAGITVNPTSGLTTTESGGTATFTIVLTSQPTANVTIGLSSSDTSEGAVSPASLTFTSANWNAPQTVAVTGVDDAVVDGNEAYTVVIAAAASSDPAFNGLDPADVPATNTNDDAAGGPVSPPPSSPTAGITVNPTSGLVTTEAGGTATFTIVPTSQPTANVTIALSSTDTTEGTVSPLSLTFTTVNWASHQTVTITGVDDEVSDGAVAYSIVTAAADSADANYNGVNPADVSATNTDDETADIVVSPTSGLVTTEGGGTAQFTVVLNMRPAANVTVGFSSSDLSEGSVTPASVNFTSTDWDTPKTVTITGVDDDFDDGDIAHTIVTAPAASADPVYDDLDPTDVSVTNIDDDSAGVTVSPTGGLVTTEAGAAAQFTVVLDSQPTANVTVNLRSSDTTEGTISPGTLIFTSANWYVPRTVIVTGVDEAVADGTMVYAVVTAAAISADQAYSGVNPADVSVTNRDDDTAGITVTLTGGINVIGASTQGEADDAAPAEDEGNHGQLPLPCGNGILAFLPLTAVLLQLSRTRSKNCPARTGQV